MSDLEPQLTALVLRDVASHLELGHVMDGRGDWVAELPNRPVPRRRRTRRIHDAATRRAQWDAAWALRWIADRNDPPKETTA